MSMRPFSFLSLGIIIVYMLDITFVRKNAELVQVKSADKGYPVDVAHVLSLDTAFRALLTEVEVVRRERNALADSLKSSKPSPEQIAMFQFFNGQAYDADIQALRKMYPQLKPLERYLRENGWENAQPTAETQSNWGR